MKKLLPLLFILSLFVALTACSEEEKGRSLKDFPQATTGDSMIYYYAQLRAQDYWKKADADTSLRSLESRKEYLKGVRAGIEAVRKNHPAYNDGVRMGARMAVNLLKFESKYHVDLNDEILIASLAKGLYGYDDIPELQYQDEFYRLLGEMKRDKRKRDVEKVHATLTEVAQEMNLEKISDDLYFRIVHEGQGPNAHKGDIIYLTTDYQLTGERDLDIPSPEMVTVGASGAAPVMTQAYCKLNKGAVGVFATSAYALFGSRADIMNLKNSDVVLIYITINEIVDDPKNADGTLFGDSDF